MYRKAIRLNTLAFMRNAPDPDIASYADERSKLVVWFSEQFEEIRIRFAPFLRVK
jgi:hypothetical protein